MKISIKRLIVSILFILALLTTSVSPTVSVYAYDGNAEGESFPVWKPGGSTGKDVGFNGFGAYRIMFVKLNPDYGGASNVPEGSDEYFYVKNNNEVYYRDNITKCKYYNKGNSKNYKDVKSLYYFDKGHDKHTDYRCYWNCIGDDGSGNRKVTFRKTAEMKKRLGCPEEVLFDLGKLSEWIRDEKNTKKIVNCANELGMDIEDPADLYLVVERAAVFKCNTNDVYNDICVSPQCAYYDKKNYKKNGQNVLKSALSQRESWAIPYVFENADITANMTGDWTKKSKPKTRKLINSNNAEVKWKNEGYGLFILANPKSATGGANIAVEYQGEPNTSDADKFKIDSSFQIKNRKKDENQYYSLAEQKFVTFTDSDKKESLNIKNISVNNGEYSVVFADTYVASLSKSIKVSSFLDYANKTGSDGFKLTWGSKEVKSSKINVGYVYRVVSIDGKKSTVAIKDKLVKILKPNTVAEVKAQESISSESKEWKDNAIVKTCYNVFNSAFNRNNKQGSNKDVIDETSNKIIKNRDFGLGIEFIAKGKPVESSKYTITAKTTESGKVKSVNAEKTWSEKYSSGEEVKTKTHKDVVIYVIVPNSNAVDINTVTSKVKDILSNGTDIKTGFKNIFSERKKTGSESDTSISLGCTNTEDVEGYTIYELIINGSKDSTDTEKPSEGDGSDGFVELPAHMLNRYFNNIIQTSSSNKGSRIRYTLTKDWAHDSKKDVKTTCPISGAKFITEYGKDWRLMYKDISSGVEFGLDNGSLLQHYYPEATGVWDKSNRKALQNWVTLDTEHMPELTLVVDYAYNLVRAANNKDVRSISGISYKDYVTATKDTKNLLRLKDNFDVIPKTVETAKSIRNPQALVTTFNESMFIDTKFKLTNNKKTKHEYFPLSHHNYHVKREVIDKVVYETICDGFDYIAKGEDHTILAFRKNYSKVSVLDHSFSNKVKKYSTDKINTGINTAIGTGNIFAIRTKANKPNEGAVSDDNEYRFASSLYNGVELKFYPEVKMVYLIGGTSFPGVNANYKSVRTIGEQLRTAKSSTLYLYKINANGNGKINGTTTSDAAQGGTAISGQNSVTIPAGADVYVAADPSGFTIDLYAYGLDVIDKKYDTSMKTSSSTTTPYKKIVASDKDVHSIWNNADNYTTIKKSFENWCNTMLDVTNYAADFELYVNDVNKSENFSASVGNIKKGSIKSDGTYSLNFENGKLIESGDNSADYTKMIKQIAADYDCSESDAKTVFKASGLYTAILEAIESSTDDFNKSGKATPGASSWTSDLGNNTNWYDEKVKTIVVRRFKNIGNQIQDITAVDKIDYGLAPNGNDSNKQNANGGNAKNAKWYINIFFSTDIKNDGTGNENIDNCLLGNGKYYNPHDGTGNKINEASNTYSVLVNKAPVLNADFNISATNTSDFY